MVVLETAEKKKYIPSQYIGNREFIRLDGKAYQKIRRFNKKPYLLNYITTSKRKVMERQKNEKRIGMEAKQVTKTRIVPIDKYYFLYIHKGKIYG